MQRRDFLQLCAAGWILSGSACFRRRPGALQILRVSATKLLNMSSLYLAHESGYFTAAGFDLEFLQTANPLEGMALLAGGKCDIALNAFNSAYLNAVAKGLPIRIVAGREMASPVCGNVGSIYGMRRRFPRGLEDLSQLKGKRIAAGPAIGLSQFALDAQLERAGLTGNDVTTVNMPSVQAIAALIGGSLDAIVLNTELDRSMSSISEEIVHSPGLARIYPNFQYSYIYFGNTLLTSDPDIGARFLAAYLRGAREFVQGKTPRFMEEYAKSNGLDVDFVKSACRETIALDGEVDLKSLQLFVDWAWRKSYSSQPVNPAELADLRFLRKVHAK